MARDYWAVQCRNQAFHSQRNMFLTRKIRIATNDLGSPHPEGPITVTCDEEGCGYTDVYKTSEIIPFCC
jgi:vancomycin permeability regulator SanA